MMMLMTVLMIDDRSRFSDDHGPVNHLLKTTQAHDVSLEYKALAHKPRIEVEERAEKARVKAEEWAATAAKAAKRLAVQEALLEATRDRNRSTLEECICNAQSRSVSEVP